MATERKAPGAPGAPIPDLEVRRPTQSGPGRGPERPVPVPNPSVPATSKAKAPAGVHDYFGSGTFDADHFGDVGGGSILEMDESRAAAVSEFEHSSEGAGSDAASIELGGGPAPPRGKSAASEGAWPSGRTPDSSSITIDPVEVRIAADYGAAPTGSVTAPIYTVRVLQRRRDLRLRLQEATNAFSRAEKTRDDLLVATAQELRGKVLLADGGEDLFAPVLEIERLALERRSALAGTNAEYDRRAREIDDGVASLRQQAAAKGSEVGEAGAVLAERNAALDRAAAKKKRLYIEIRGLLDAAEKSAGRLSGPQAARVAELEAAVAAHNPELERTERDVKTAEASLLAAEADAKQIARRLAEGARVRRALDDEFQKQIGARSEGVTESERERANALAEVMRRLLALRGRLVEVPKDVLEGIARGDEAVSKKAWELEKLVRAIDSYDRSAYQRGMIVAGVAILAFMGVVGVLLFT